MDSATVRQRLLHLFPALRSLPATTLDEVLRRGELRVVPRGTVLFDVHGPCRGFPMVLSGSVRVSRRAAQGRELELYRVRPGDGCVISSSCLLGRAQYNATGIAETDVALFFLPADLFAELIAREGAFRDYVFGLFGARLADIMELVDAVAFQRLDRRLAALLLGQGEIVRTTHQQLADRLGSVREIVGRLLRNFEDRGLVALAREHVRVLDPDGLRAVAEGAFEPRP